MSSYLIEVRSADRLTQRRIDHAVASLGSYFVAHASWRQSGAARIGSMVVDCDGRAEALSLVPPSLRAFAHVTRLGRVKAA